MWDLEQILLRPFGFLIQVSLVGVPFYSYLNFLNFEIRGCQSTHANRKKRNLWWCLAGVDSKPRVAWICRRFPHARLVKTNLF